MPRRRAAAARLGVFVLKRRRRWRRGTSCTSCPSRRGRGRCGRLWLPCLTAVGGFLRLGDSSAGAESWKRCAAAARWASALRRRSSSICCSVIGSRRKSVLIDRVLDPLLHRLEELVALLLVLVERVALAVAAQADALLEVVEGEQVVLPGVVDDAQQDVALEEAHQLASPGAPPCRSTWLRPPARASSRMLVDAESRRARGRRRLRSRSK